MSIPYHESYLGQLRQHIGKMKVFALGARAIVEDENGRFILKK